MLLRLVYCVTSLDDFISCCSVCVRYEGWKSGGKKRFVGKSRWMENLSGLNDSFSAASNSSSLSVAHIIHHTLPSQRKSEIIFHIHSFLCESRFFFLFFWISKRIFFMYFYSLLCCYWKSWKMNTNFLHRLFQSFISLAFIFFACDCRKESGGFCLTSRQAAVAARKAAWRVQHVNYM